MHEISLLSDAQEKALALVPVFSAFLSILDSGAIIRLTLAGGRLSSPYERMLFGLSVSYASSNIVNTLAAFLVPSTSRRIWGIGNNATCNAIGTL